MKCQERPRWRSSAPAAMSRDPREHTWEDDSHTDEPSHSLSIPVLFINSALRMGIRFRSPATAQGRRWGGNPNSPAIVLLLGEVPLVVRVGWHGLFLEEWGQRRRRRRRHLAIRATAAPR